MPWFLLGLSKGTVPFGGSNMPFGSTPKPTMCPLASPQDQHIFNSYLTNYLSKSVCGEG